MLVTRATLDQGVASSSDGTIHPPRVQAYANGVRALKDILLIDLKADDNTKSVEIGS